MHLEEAVDSKRFQRFFPVESEAGTLHAMRAALASIDDGYAMVLSSLDGQRLAHVAAPDTNSARLAAITGSLCALGETLGRELGQRDFRDVMVQMGTGIAVVQRIEGRRLVLMSAAGARANLGLVSSHTRFCAEALAQLGFASRD